MDNNLVEQITELVLQNLKNKAASSGKYENAIPIGISGRHLHLSRSDVDTLFGKGYQLTRKKTLMGGQYACEECVTIVGLKLRAIENVRILGPERSLSQVEISKTDAIKLGINPPVRHSGELKGAESISIVGPKGVVFLEEGCIIAKRHMHMSLEDAAKFGVHDKQVVLVQIDTERGGIMNDVLVRVDKSFTLEMHIDTDEANGFGIKASDNARIISS